VVDIQSPTAEIRRGKKEEEEEEERNRMKIYMVSLFHRATIKEQLKNRTLSKNRKKESIKNKLSCQRESVPCFCAIIGYATRQWHL